MFSQPTGGSNLTRAGEVAMFCARFSSSVGGRLQPSHQRMNARSGRFPYFPLFGEEALIRLQE